MLKNQDEDESAKPAIKETPTPGCYFKRRYILAIMGFLSLFNVYALRINLSVAIVAMVNSTEEFNNGSDTCPDRGKVNETGSNSNGVFDWNSVDQGLLLGCYFYGYIVTNIPGGWLSKRYGFKLVLGINMIFSSIITICIPIAAHSSFKLLVALRILLGFFQGISFPSIQHACSNWAPPLERSVLVGIVFSGCSLGTCLTLLLAGFVADALGWEAVFYYTGGFALLWSFVWFAIIYDTPNAHPRISVEEKTYITESIGLEQHKKDKTIQVRTPWKSMLTSLPVLGIVCGHFALCWGEYTLATMLPTYLSSILKFDLSASGAVSSLPYIFQWIFTLLGGFVTDIIRKRQITSTTAIRKINTTVGLGVSAIFVVLAGYIGCNASAAVAFLTLSLGFNSLTANTIDIAPRYGGVIYGISNTIVNISGFIAPQVIGAILSDGNNLGQWQLVFWLTAIIDVVGFVIYLILASAEEQKWAKGNIIKKKPQSIKSSKIAQTVKEHNKNGESN